MATIHVDGRAYAVEAGDNLLHACLSLGLDLPYFCWHPVLGSVGACRQCAVKLFSNDQDARGTLVMACMTPVRDGVRLSIEDREAREFRASVIEWMMLNHPHDCPVCDEGGECHLQDMTVMTGHVYRGYRGEKRTFRNQDLGPFVHHEMNRCIQCYRCVRFYRDHAGGRDFDAFSLRDQVFFGRQQDGALESVFSGNLVEVCPTGVFTDKTLKGHFTRKWDLQTGPSVCVHCGLGCNTIPGERYGTLRRIRNRFNGEVNGYFLCDRGRYGYAFVNSDRRVRRPLLRRGDGGRTEAVTAEAALQRLEILLADRSSIIGIGSPRASLEANFALATLVGRDRFYVGVPEEEIRLLREVLDILRSGPAPPASLRDVESADAVLVLGEDLTHTAPMLALAVRQAARQASFALAEHLKIPRWDDAAVRHAAQDAKSPIFLTTLHATALDDVAAETLHAAPDDLARLGFAVAHEIDPAAPPVPDLPEAARALAARIGGALRAAMRPVVVCGTSTGSSAIIRAAANAAWALCKGGRPARLCYAVPECNSLGVALLGGESLDAAIRAVRDGRAETIVILENDLFRRRDPATVRGFLEAARHVVVIDHLLHETAARAEVVLPAGTFAESEGTLVNNEGRAQRFFEVFHAEGEVREDWRWLRELMRIAGRKEAEDWRSLDDLTAACAESAPIFRALRRAAPPAGFRIAGQKIPREPHRYSGRTAMLAEGSVHEPKPPEDPDSPLAFSMEGYLGAPPPPLIPRYWAPAWNSVQALNKLQEEVGGPLRGGDPGVRLVEAGASAAVSYWNGAPSAFAPREGEWLVVPRHHLFGSEELSVLSPAVRERAPQAYVAIHPADVARLRLAADEQVDLSVGDVSYRVPYRAAPDLPRGVVEFPVGLPGLTGLVLPAWGTVRKVSET
jgi:NADH-quinone oxidoreductase subunit G